jgi:hypothetical protein
MLGKTGQLASEPGSGRVCGMMVKGGQKHTCDDGNLALQRTSKLGRVDKGVDLRPEARGELGGGGWWLGLFLGGHLCGGSPGWCCLSYDDVKLRTEVPRVELSVLVRY